MITQKNTWRCFKTSADILKPQWCSTRLKLAQNCTLWKHDSCTKPSEKDCPLDVISLKCPLVVTQSTRLFLRWPLFALVICFDRICSWFWQLITNLLWRRRLRFAAWLLAALRIPFWSVVSWFTVARGRWKKGGEGLPYEKIRRGCTS